MRGSLTRRGLGSCRAATAPAGPGSWSIPGSTRNRDHRPACRASDPAGVTETSRRRRRSAVASCRPAPSSTVTAPTNPGRPRPRRAPPANQPRSPRCPAAPPGNPAAGGPAGPIGHARSASTRSIRTAPAPATRTPPDDLPAPGTTSFYHAFTRTLEFRRGNRRRTRPRDRPDGKNLPNCAITDESRQRASIGRGLGLRAVTS